MDSSSPEYTVVHKVLDPLPDYNLILLKKDDGYCILYEYVIRGYPYIPHRRWYSIDILAWRGVRYLNLVSVDTFIEMGEFIREYVGEAQWILAVLEST